MRKIYFVCTGNTCRSPMAQALANQYFKTGKCDMLAYSRGIMTTNLKASKYAVSAMKDYGLDISGHVSMSIKYEDLENADKVITMTKEHKQYINQNFSGFDDKIYTLGEVAGTSADVTDPFGASFEIYLQCANQINELLCLYFKEYKI